MIKTFSTFVAYPFYNKLQWSRAGRVNKFQGTEEEMSASNGTVEESRNIEIKARLGSDDEYNRRVTIAKQLVGNEGEIIVQRDVFYNVSNGRLKLRYLKVIELLS